ncbi:MAG: hypothetical protein JOZ73_05025 [Solirubrobacterales bacterium]|nr:hypothetical protein [Solirubrobacterales bacterium]
MGTLITTSDGHSVELNSDFDGIVTVVADALDRHKSTDDERRRRLPRGFCQFDTVDGREVV